MRKILSANLNSLPPTVNHLYRTSRTGTRYKTREGRDWQEITAAVFHALYGGAAPYDGDVMLDICFLVADKRRWDIDNRVKALIDALVMGGVLKDDRQVQSLHVQREHVPETTQTLVLVKEWIR